MTLRSNQWASGPPNERTAAPARRVHMQRPPFPSVLLSTLPVLGAVQQVPLQCRRLFPGAILRAQVLVPPHEWGLSSPVCRHRCYID
jgi:hypothetical protein